MSEYQYYEFQAIDEPLDEQAMEALRDITSRAEITPTSLINEYHWGNFKGNPLKLMQKYFDAHLYFANWGTHILMLRLPRRLFDPKLAKPYAVQTILDIHASGEHVILEFHAEDENGDFDTDESDAMSPMIQLRSDLMAGDLRCLYLAWLSAVGQFEVDDEEVEPPVPPGLGQLTGALNRFADFLYVDPQLIEAAAAKSAAAPPEPTEAEVRTWVTGLPPADKDAALARLMLGEPGIAAELSRRFRSARDGGRPDAASAGRTAGEFRARRDAVYEEERRRAEEKAARDRERQERQAAEARARHLDSLIGREEHLWQRAETAVMTRQPKGYDSAVTLLKDLRDLAERHHAMPAFASRLRDLSSRHQAKQRFIERLAKAFPATILTEPVLPPDAVRKRGGGA